MVRNITATERSSTHVRLHWQKPRGNITHYRLLCSCSGGGIEYEIPKDETFRTINNLSPGPGPVSPNCPNYDNISSHERLDRDVRIAPIKVQNIISQCLQLMVENCRNQPIIDL